MYLTHHELESVLSVNITIRIVIDPLLLDYHSTSLTLPALPQQQFWLQVHTVGALWQFGAAGGRVSGPGARLGVLGGCRP